MNDYTVAIAKAARETIKLRLGEFKDHKFIDMRIFTREDGKEPAPTKKVLAVSPQCGRNSGEQWPRRRRL